MRYFRCIGVKDKHTTDIIKIKCSNGNQLIVQFGRNLAMKSASHLIWIDLEMTGLDPNKEKIIEIATIVTDKDLNILAEGPMMAVTQPKALLDQMDSWCVEHHGQSGLTQRVLDSQITDQQAEQATIEFLQQWIDPGKSPMCGNSIGQDRRFLVRYMPKLHDYFHYRNIDVSTLKELSKRWKPQILDGFKKQNKHLALDDIRESIQELEYYRQHLLDCPTNN